MRANGAGQGASGTHCERAARTRRRQHPKVAGGTARAEHRYYRLAVDSDVESRLVAIPAGRVTLSDRRTRRTWPVEVAAFRLGPFPVTQEMYARVTGDSPSAARGARLPVESISWWDAIRFCNALTRQEGRTPAYRIDAGERQVEWDVAADGYRLPTEAEWEWACRAGTAGPRYGPLEEIAWYRGNSEEHLHEVGARARNPWGLYDMLGNVWDWCWDTYDAEVYGDYKVLRGGGWFDEHWSCRASVRRRGHPDFRVDDVGFRLARSQHAGGAAAPATEPGT